MIQEFEFAILIIIINNFYEVPLHASNLNLLSNQRIMAKLGFFLIDIMKVFSCLVGCKYAMRIKTSKISYLSSGRIKISVSL